jgi:hypothetical protein
MIGVLRRWWHQWAMCPECGMIIETKRMFQSRAQAQRTHDVLTRCRGVITVGPR